LLHIKSTFPSFNIKIVSKNPRSYLLITAA
jgi:hypothetical protein